MPLAGPMRFWLQIFASSETSGTGGDPQRAWSSTPSWSVWAHKRAMSAREATIAQARQSNEEVVFETWPISGLTDQHRILCDSVYYDITGIRDPDGLGRKIHIYASAAPSYGAA